jgi:hypothetical protein
VEADETRVHEIVRRTSFKEMKDNPVTNYKHWDGYGIRDPHFQEFMRKGERSRRSRLFMLRTGQCGHNLRKLHR